MSTETDPKAAPRYSLAQRYSLAEIRNGTGWTRGERFVLAKDIRPLEALLAEAVEYYSKLTTVEFANGDDRDMRRKMAAALGLDPADYSL
jgi:hypothetical protein